MDDLTALLASQCGVIARRQVLGCALTPADLARLVRHRDLTRVHPGVYVDHTGPLTWDQRAWAAVLFSWPAALSHASALRVGDGSSIVHVAVDRSRHLVAPDGVRIHRMADFDARTLWNTGPPRIRFEHSVLDVAGAAPSDLRAVAVLADACGSRRSTAERLRLTLDDRPRQQRRAWLSAMLDDVAAGTCSVLEHGYFNRVERPHDLPVGLRQASHRHSGVLTLRDVEYAEVGVVVELDGRLFHDSTTSRDRDMDRDLDGAAEDAAMTLRLSWGQVFDRPCRTADRVARVLVRRGWSGHARRCPDCG